MFYQLFRMNYFFNHRNKLIRLVLALLCPKNRHVQRNTASRWQHRAESDCSADRHLPGSAAVGLTPKASTSGVWLCAEHKQPHHVSAKVWVSQN